MLILTRRPNEVISIGNNVFIKIKDIDKHGNITFVIQASPRVNIVCKELHDKYLRRKAELID